MVAALPPGDDALRRQIALRYLMAGMVVHAWECVGFEVRRESGYPYMTGPGGRLARCRQRERLGSFLFILRGVLIAHWGPHRWLSTTIITREPLTYRIYPIKRDTEARARD
jgi:hypothetical protein